MANEQTRAAAGWNVGVISLMIAAMLVGLPLAVWLDLRNLVASNLLHQANDVNSVISSMRSYYSTNVVGRILAAPEGATRVSAHFETIPGAIPIPSTLSLELGRVIGVQQKNIRYRFVSDYPFKGRAPHALDDFETGALANLRADPTLEPTEVSGGRLSDNVRVAVDRRQLVFVQIPVDLFRGDGGLGPGLHSSAIAPGQRNKGRQRRTRTRQRFSGVPVRQDFALPVAADLQEHLQRPEGRDDPYERKLLTIFFSDIKDFTATTERLAPELITKLLNEYLTEMSAIAQAHGGTIDQFIG